MKSIPIISSPSSKILLKAFLILLIAYCPCEVLSQDFRFTNIPSWVKINEFSSGTFEIDEKEVKQGYYLVHSETQVSLPEESSFFQMAYRITNSTGVQNISDLEFDFNPYFQKMNFHSIQVLRGGRWIDKLDRTSFDQVPYENRSVDKVYSGRAKVSVHLDDLRPGDILVYSYSIVGNNPVFGGKYHDSHYLCAVDSLARLIVRIVSSKEKLYYQTVHADLKPQISSEGGVVEYLWEDKNVSPIHVQDFPSWTDDYPILYVSEFRDWEEVIQWGQELFHSKTNLGPKLNEFIGELKSLERNEQILETIRFIQDSIRYLSVSIGTNSHEPHDPKDVFSRKYGDCKDKVFLFSTIMSALEIESYPVLVSTYKGLSINNLLPSPLHFDHCIAIVQYGDSSRFVDLTVTHQRGDLNALYMPYHYGHGLILKPGQKEPEAIAGNGPYGISTTENYSLDSIGGGCLLEVVTRYNGGFADYQRSSFEAKSLSEVEDDYTSFYERYFTGVKVLSSISIADDSVGNVFSIYEKYKIEQCWEMPDSQEQQLFFYVQAHSLSDYVSLPSDENYEGPYDISFPLSVNHHININLPESWDVEPDENVIRHPNFEYSSTIRSKEAGQKITLSYSYKALKLYVESDDLTSYRDQMRSLLDDVYYQLSYNSALLGAKALNLKYVIGFTIFWLLVCVFLTKIIYQWDPDPLSSSIKSHYKIGGWLILPLIGLFITVMTVSSTLITEFFNYDLWKLLSLDYSSSNFGLSLLVMAELVFNISLLVYSVLLIVLFLQNRSSVPFLMVSFYLGIFLFMALDAFFANALSIGNTDTFLEKYSDLFRSLVSALIWIPYFLISERVKSVFRAKYQGVDHSSILSEGV